MSFWKYAFAPAQVDSISSILSNLPAEAAPSSPSSSSPPDATTHDLASTAPYEAALDELLATPDLLSEIKSDTNIRLKDFLARAEVVHRLGGWVVWGLGRPLVDEVPNGGLIADDIEDGQVPDFVVAAAVPKEVGMGGVPRRRNMDEMGVLEGGGPETEQEKAWSVFPRLCCEILSSEAPSLTDVLFDSSVASTQPHTCPTPLSFLLPFWESLLGCTEVQLETRSVQVGYWARVNGVLLSGPRGQEVLAHILTIPHLLPRLLALLPFCSPINDLLLLLLRVSTPPSPLIPAVVNQAIRMLDPFAALGKEGHVAAEDLLKGILELCSAAPAAPPPGPPGGPQSQDMGLEWRDNSLARQIADERSVRTLVDWMLAGTEEKLALTSKAAAEAADDQGTPRAGATLPLYTGTPEQKADLRTSSLVQSIAVLVDLIRKNNSDFVEQHMLTWARRKETEAHERELLEADGSELVEGLPGGDDDTDKGPALVDLSAMLSIVAERIPGFQELIREPRSLRGPMETSAGSIIPLTLERFRICEFYAELLHCSNMSLLNRPPHLSPYLYDDSGFLARGWQAADDLADALAGPPPEEEDHSAHRRAPSPPGPALPLKSNPIDLPSTSYSGLSTPSGQGSLDSESGILTRAEAKELKEIVKAAEQDGEAAEADEGSDGGDPFGDPEDDEGGSDDDLAEATEGIDLNNELERTQPAPTTKPDVPSSPSAQTSPSPASPTPSSPPLPRPPLPPGPMLKRQFMEHKVIPTMLDMFFTFPWNNFLHNVVFDVLQQIFHGRVDRLLDRELALSVFIEGRLIDRILEGHADNDANCARSPGARLGYMGHMILIADEIVKLFEHYPQEIYEAVKSHIPQPGWDNYVNTTLRETRDRDLLPLGGGISLAPADAASIASGLSDEDDEFPMNSSRTMRALDMGGQAGGGAAADEGAFGGHAKASSSNDAGEPGSSDQFSRYLANAISSDRPDKFGSSDEDDDDDANWMGDSDPVDGDFVLGDSSPSAPKFGFDDRFESTGRQVFRSSSPDSEDEGEWGAFSASDSPAAVGSAPNSSSFFQDEFKPTVASSSAGFGTSAFDDAFGDDNFASATPNSAEEDEDDFGDFENGPSITLPSLDDALDDFDLGEESRPTLEIPTPSFGARPAFGRRITADDGSALFGGLSSSFDDLQSPPASPSVQADLATSLDEPLGPSMTPSAHLSKDGFVEAEVEGKQIRVPADDIVLAHRRSSLDGAERPTNL